MEVHLLKTVLLSLRGAGALCNAARQGPHFQEI